jgi:hypothetical protein
MTALALALGLARTAWNLLFVDVIRKTVQSTSPDDMYRATITEWGGGVIRRGVHSRIVVEKATNPVRNSKDEREIWEEVTKEPIPVDDSAGSNDYSLTWERNATGQSTRLRVSGDGVLPGNGTVIVKLSK